MITQKKIHKNYRLLCVFPTAEEFLKVIKRDKLPDPQIALVGGELTVCKKGKLVSYVLASKRKVKATKIKKPKTK